MAKENLYRLRVELWLITGRPISKKTQASLTALVQQWLNDQGFEAVMARPAGSLINEMDLADTKPVSVTYYPHN